MAAKNLVAAAAAAALATPAFSAYTSQNVAIEMVDGCYYLNHKYDGHRLHEEALSSLNVGACQKLCQNDDACHYFTFFESQGECYKLGKNAVYDDKGAAGATSGPKFCPEIPSGCFEIPAAGFPGNTPDETEMLFPSHRQPSSLECWPRNDKDGMYDSCPTKTVLEDSTFGWPAMCMDLVAKSGPQKKDSDTGIPENESCESLCTKTPECSMWMVVNDTTQACWHGLGNNCYQREDKSFPGVVRAQRIMHGEVRVLANLTRVQIWGLKKAFDSNFFIYQRPDAVEACRNHCYSNIKCQYWQYSSVTGCWTEEPSPNGADAVEYPLTTHVATEDSHMAEYIIAGEYIQHICPGAHNIPKKFSAAFIPKSVRFAPPAEQLSPSELNSALRAQHPDIHGAPPQNNHLYGSRAYHEAYNTAGAAAQQAAASPGLKVVTDGAQPLHSAKASEAEVLYGIDDDASKLNEQSGMPNMQTVLEILICASGSIALVAVMCLSFRPSRRHRPLRSAVDASDPDYSPSMASEP